jgi:7,8-dihydropterin-6-yl-methyl-4-(beta-D-ribofuranosyl)aminobenzene 5'-phosphate synthase
MKHIVVTSVLLAAAVVLSSFHTPKHQKKMKSGKEITLTILYDNYKYEEGYRNTWGFSCLIEGLGQTILFDTGGPDGNLMHNFEVAGKDPQDVDLIVLSHIHWDHTGGIDTFLTAKNGIDIVMPRSFPEEFRKGIEAHGAHPVLVDEARKVTEHVWSTGEMGDEIIEQSLVVETPRGLIVITGCAHPGIEDIVRKAMEMKDDRILLVMGGFHLLRTGKHAVEDIAREFKDMEIQYAAPTHCSGDQTLAVFREVFGDKYLKLGTGRVIETAGLE